MHAPIDAINGGMQHDCLGASVFCFSKAAFYFLRAALYNGVFMSRPLDRNVSFRPLVFFFSLALAFAFGLPAPFAHAQTVRNAEDLMIVDCLLPGQIRRLGSQTTFMSARRPIRTTQADCQIRGGEYVSFDRANYQTALKVWMESAMSGDPEAMKYVGEIYLKGLGIDPDYGMAQQWFRKAAVKGNNRAKINLGYMYEAGLGVERDMAKALNLYREASGGHQRRSDFFVDRRGRVASQGKPDKRAQADGRDRARHIRTIARAGQTVAVAT
jgi:TPR repeat protein